MKETRLLRPVIIALVCLSAAFISLHFVPRPAYAQEPIDVVKVLNQPSPVVKVGQFISFTVHITNQSSFTLIHATLFDDYRQDILGNFSMIGGSPGPTLIDTVNGELTWTDLISQPAAAGYFPELPPNQGISVTMQFQIQHPPVGGFTVVNQAEIRDAIFSNGSSGNSGMNNAPTVPITGGSAALTKQLDPPGQTPNVGDQITYTLFFTNEGAAAITNVVVADTFNPNQLLFITATPTVPTTIDNVNGIITWINLATPPIPAGGVISLTVTFEVLQAGVTILNRGGFSNVQDEFGNNLAPGSGEAGILIIDDSQPVKGDDNNDNDNDSPAPTATAPILSTPTPVIMVAGQGVTDTTQITDTSTPKYLPETGQWSDGSWFALPVGLILLALSWYLSKKLTIER